MNLNANIEEIKNKHRDSVPTTRSLFQIGDGGSIPLSPLQFEIVEIKPQLASELNEKWHSKLPRIHWSNIVRNSHYICFAAEYEGRYYAVGIWSSPVAQNRFKDGKFILELRRFAICREAPKYTATWMLSKMIKIIKKKFPDIKRLISYQDKDVHKGIIYKAANWKIGSEVDFISWQNRPRNLDQSTAQKVRWEYNF